MENNLEVSVVENPQDTALYLLTKAEIDIAISTAKAFPRSVKQSIDRATSMATLTEDIAASCSYSVPRAGKNIEGPSVRLAEIVCTSFGNINSGARVIDNDGKTITAQGICHDLETNNRVTVEVKRKITDRNGKTFSEDMQVVAGNAACAIAFRNAVYKVVPAALIQPIYEEAKRVAKGTSATLVTRRNNAVEYFKGLGITEQQICDKLEVKKIEDIDLDKLTMLRGMKTAIETGEVFAKDLFEKESNGDEAKAAANEKLNSLKAGEQTSIPVEA